MNGTFEIQNEVRRKEFAFVSEDEKVRTNGSAEFDNENNVKHISAAVYADSDGEKTYRGSFNVTRQGDGTLLGSYNPQTDDDLDILLESKKAVVAQLTENDNA